MSTIIHYTNCPVCGSSDIKNVLLAKDHTVSRETFPIAECKFCTLRFTQDVPDSHSISKYYKSEDYISHTNTSKGIINRMYKFVRKQTMKKKRRLVEKITGISNGQILDMGSGVGSFVNEMKQKGWKATGLEPDKEARDISKKLYQLELKDISEFYQFIPASFDAITLWHVLEHVHDLDDCLQQLRILLKENGKLFIAVPNYTSTDAAIYKEYWAAYDVPRHLYHFSPGAMQVLMERHKFKILKYKAMWYDSFYISLLSSKYKNDKANLFTSFRDGIRSNLNALRDVTKCSSVIYIIGK
jgi:2-polyprenyl-3-methyl-5-hydroxy-6-metoxy-1,4-benzoquinol methylase